MAKIEGHVYLQRTSKGYAKRYLVLNGTDLYAYKSGDRDKLIFMHSLLSTVIEEPNQLEVAQSELGHKLFFKIDIQLSLGQKRILYFENATERERWSCALRSALGEEGRRIADHYEYGDKLLGQGSFGKVYKGVNKENQ
jgi:hypothetical protein